MAGFVDLLSEGDRDELDRLGVRRRLAPGTVLFREGDAGTEAILVVRGDVKVGSTTPSGQEVVLTVLPAGSIVGELAAIDGGPRSATATVLTPAEVLAVPAARFGHFLESRPRLLRELLVSVTGKLRDTSRRQCEWGTADALGRTCTRLVELAERWGETEGDELIVRSPLTQADLAAWSGLSREAVVKALRSLRRLGWIENRGSRFVIRDLAALRDRSSP